MTEVTARPKVKAKIFRWWDWLLVALFALATIGGQEQRSKREAAEADLRAAQNSAAQAVRRATAAEAKLAAIQASQVTPPVSAPAPNPVAAPAVAAVSTATPQDPALRSRCIEQAKQQNYRSGQCAYSFIDACIRTQSRSEMEKVLRADAMLGMGTALSCPNMPSTYVTEFDRF